MHEIFLSNISSQTSPGNSLPIHFPIHLCSLSNRKFFFLITFKIFKTVSTNLRKTKNVNYFQGIALLKPWSCAPTRWTRTTATWRTWWTRRRPDSGQSCTGFRTVRRRLAPDKEWETCSRFKTVM